MMPPEEKLNKNYKRKETPRELLPLRKEDQLLARSPRRKEEASSLVLSVKWRTHSEELMMLGPNKRRNSLSVLLMKTRRKMTNEVIDCCLKQFSYT